ncbi:MAG TPA: MFS transporter, partial [Candidatus Binataceae bacterium]|nr:MFS transporter [Candidatus Binataceae bacterium]
MSTLVGSGILLVRRRADATGTVASRILSPLKTLPFLAFLAGSLVGSFGSRISELTAIWYMTELTRSPLLVSLVTTAFSLPGFLLALPAGALGDVADRRRLLSIALGLISVTMAAMALLTMR